ncbi:MAG: VrrA/YqfQ family protein [Bacilli bacterium]|nr:VrrA/YqfQ family protein [Bacilli bacterium]MDD4808964.1 VrrA/YqfQ family protein [Bacilli bacterium]
MNYYNPYFMNPYMMPAMGNRGLFSNLFKGINWSSIINGTQKTLGIVNQTIPLVRQVTPLLKNTKTMFKVMNEFKKVDTPTINNKTNIVSSTNPTPNQNTTSQISDGGPTFFL